MLPVAAILTVVSCALAQPLAAERPGVLDLNRGSFRAFMAWRTGELVDAEGRLQPLREPPARGVKEEDRRAIPIRASAAPGEDWASPDFDDRDWLRMHGPAQVHQGDWDRLWLRGKFLVRDPATAGELTLSLAYVGGVVVYLNGRELTRLHLPEGTLGPRTFASPYPQEAYVRPDGRPYGRDDSRDNAMAARMKTRIREAADLKIPGSALRKGVNVLGVLCLGSPVAEFAEKLVPAAEMWSHAGVRTLRLTGGEAGQVEPNVGPAPGVAIGNMPPVATLLAWDYVPAADTLGPVCITGARNGSFSGRIVLSSAEAITGLKATAADLAAEAGGARIPASAVEIRWAAPSETGLDYLPADRFDRLLPTPPDQVTPRMPMSRGVAMVPVAVALAPMWITVHVPADAAAGLYSGNISVAAKAADKAESFIVPVQVEVFDWRVPDPSDFWMFNNIHHSPDTEAAKYGVPLWSEKHFELMGWAMDLLRQVGNRALILNMVAKAHGHGNSESIVRWIRQADGSYKYDFTLAERYMDLFQKVVGKPQAVQVNVWMFGGDNPAKPKWPPESVTVYDADGKKLEDLQQPPYGTPENQAFWRPALDELRKRLEKRGWWDETVLGWLDYCNPPADSIVKVAGQIWPGASWYKNAHAPSKSFGPMPVRYSAWVWGCGPLYNPDMETPWAKPPVFFPDGRKAYPQPWKQAAGYIPLAIPRIGVAFTRPGVYDWSPVIRLRTLSEAALQAGLRGLSMVGADFWPVESDRPGRYYVVCDGRGGVTPINNTKALLGRGPDGPVFTERLEALREGIQIAEAMVLLQKALESGRLDEATTARVQTLLDERARQYLRNMTPSPGGPSYDADWMTLQATPWRQRDRELFALAAEVAGKVGDRK